MLIPGGLSLRTLSWGTLTPVEGSRGRAMWLRRCVSLYLYLTMTIPSRRLSVVTGRQGHQSLPRSPSHWCMWHCHLSLLSLFPTPGCENSSLSPHFNPWMHPVRLVFLVFLGFAYERLIFLPWVTAVASVGSDQHRWSSHVCWALCILSHLTVTTLPWGRYGIVLTV